MSETVEKNDTPEPSEASQMAAFWQPGSSGCLFEEYHSICPAVRWANYYAATLVLCLYCLCYSGCDLLHNCHWRSISEAGVFSNLVGQIVTFGSTWTWCHYGSAARLDPSFDSLSQRILFEWSWRCFLSAMGCLPW